MINMDIKRTFIPVTKEVRKELKSIGRMDENYSTLILRLVGLVKKKESERNDRERQ